MFTSLNQLGSLVLDIDGNRLDAKFIRETNSIGDYFTILKADVLLGRPSILPDGRVQLALTNVAAGKTNIIQASSALPNWLSISTNTISSNSFNFVDVDATNHSTRLYRVLRLP